MKNLKAKEDGDLRLSRYLKALGHPVRVAIIRILKEKCRCPHGCSPCECGEHCEGEHCQCGCTCGSLVDRFPFSQSTVSQHIKELKSAGLIRQNNRKGDYTINHPNFSEALHLLKNLLGDKELREEERTDENHCHRCDTLFCLPG